MSKRKWVWEAQNITLFPGLSLIISNWHLNSVLPYALLCHKCLLNSFEVQPEISGMLATWPSYLYLKSWKVAEPTPVLSNSRLLNRSFQRVSFANVQNERSQLSVGKDFQCQESSWNLGSSLEVPSAVLATWAIVKGLKNRGLHRNSPVAFRTAKYLGPAGTKNVFLYISVP